MDKNSSFSFPSGDLIPQQVQLGKKWRTYFWENILTHYFTELESQIQEFLEERNESEVLESTSQTKVFMMTKKFVDLSSTNDDTIQKRYVICLGSLLGNK